MPLIAPNPIRELARAAYHQDLPPQELDRLGAELLDRLSRLTNRQAAVLRLRFGLDGGLSRTHRQIASALGITPQRSQQLELFALSRLRQAHHWTIDR